VRFLFTLSESGFEFQFTVFLNYKQNKCRVSAIRAESSLNVSYQVVGKSAHVALQKKLLISGDKAARALHIIKEPAAAALLLSSFNIELHQEAK
jgi:hypothetical protein